MTTVPTWKEDLVSIGISRKVANLSEHGFHSIPRNWARFSTPSRLQLRKIENKKQLS